MLWLEQNVRHSITNLVINEPMVLVVKLFMDDGQYIVAFHVTGNPKLEDCMGTLLYFRKHIGTLILDVRDSMAGCNGDNTLIVVTN